MNQFHQLAIELRYEGKTYEDISKALEGNLAVGTLKQYFAEDGLLDYEYHRYAEQQSKARRDLGLDILKSQVKKAATVIVEALNKALEQGDYTKAVKYAEIILDRVGILGVEAPKDQITDGKIKMMSNDEFRDYLIENGINPDAFRLKGSHPQVPIAS